LKRFGSQSMYKKIDRLILKHPRHAFISQEHLRENWQSFHYADMPDMSKALEEYKAFENIIRDNVKNVHYLPPAEHVGLDSIYTHDPVKITVAGAIGFPMGKDLRASEHRETLTLLNSLGVPTLGVIEHPAKIEGGDVVWIDEETVALGLGYRTNMAGINRFKELTRGLIKEYIIVPLPHVGGEKECLHLMSVISIVDKDLAVVYSKYMPVFFRQYLLEKGFSFVEVPDHEYENLGSNVLALAPRICVMMEGNKITADNLREHNALVYTYPGGEISFKGTGGPTCLTCPVTRD
jgi:arginine deiminase